MKAESTGTVPRSISQLVTTVTPTVKGPGNRKIQPLVEGPDFNKLQATSEQQA